MFILLKLFLTLYFRKVQREQLFIVMCKHSRVTHLQTMCRCNLSFMLLVLVPRRSRSLHLFTIPQFWQQRNYIPKGMMNFWLKPLFYFSNVWWELIFVFNFHIPLILKFQLSSTFRAAIVKSSRSAGVPSFMIHVKLPFLI